MVKAMVFVDGTWLYANRDQLAQSLGLTDFRIDFGRLPRVLARKIQEQVEGPVDVVRTYLFGSYAANYDSRDAHLVRKRLDFFAMLKEEFRYEVEVFPINFQQRRVRRMDRSPHDDFEPQEKCVDIALATSMLYFAAMPGTYDVAICVLGDRDFIPALQHVRRLGKRVAIASIKGPCAPEYADPRDEARVKDFEIIWLEDLVGELELKYERHQLECQSGLHRGPRLVWTTFHPKRGQKFYCDDCRAEIERQKQEHQSRFVAQEINSDALPGEYPGVAVGDTLEGYLKNKVEDRGYGFLHGPDGPDYFFHFSDLENGLEYAEMNLGERFQFEVKRLPAGGRAGAAMNVRRVQADPSAGSGNSSAPLL